MNGKANNPRPRQTTVEILLKGIPRSLRNKFKGFCAERGSDMTKELRRFMEQCTTGHVR